MAKYIGVGIRGLWDPISVPRYMSTGCMIPRDFGFSMHHFPQLKSGFCEDWNSATEPGRVSTPWSPYYLFDRMSFLSASSFPPLQLARFPSSCHPCSLLRPSDSNVPMAPYPHGSDAHHILMAHSSPSLDLLQSHLVSGTALTPQSTF